MVNDFLESLDRFKEELSEDNYKLRMTEAEEKIQGILETHKALINDLPKRVITTLNTSTTVSRTKVPTSVTPPPPHSY